MPFTAATARRVQNKEKFELGPENVPAIVKKSPKLLDKAIVLYFPAEQLGSHVGAHCGDCWKFVGSESGPGTCIEVEGAIAPANGICGLYVNGRVFDGAKPDLPAPVVQISKTIAGYVEEGPTHCGNCEYYKGSDEGSGPCEKVAGTVEYFGCCNHWSQGD